MNRPRPAFRRLRGISLVELMIGLTLSLFILGALAQAFSFASGSRRNQESTAVLMDGARAATEIIGRAARMATYWGCSGSADSDVKIHRDTDPPQSADQLYTSGIATKGIFAIDANTTTGAAAELITWQALDNFTAVASSGFTLAPDTSGSTVNLVARSSVPIKDATGTFQAGDWVAIGDCQKGDVFKVQSATAAALSIANGSKSSCLSCSTSYASNAMVQKVQRNRFYIATGKRGRPALHLQRDNASGIELVEGVEAMTLEFGIDADLDGFVDVSGTTPTYLAATNITAPCLSSLGGSKEDTSCWRRVSSLRITLLMSTVEDGVTPNEQTYTINGQTVKDRRLRREFVTAISLRNDRN